MNSCSYSLPRIGLFGGTFDPVHLGHLILAETAFEKLKLDRLIFIPAKVSPYKTNLPPAASAEDRVAMLKLAVEERDSWSVDTRELFRKGPSFTIDTVRALQTEHQDAIFFLLIGQDQLAGLAGWKEIKELKKLVSFVLLSRIESGIKFQETDFINDQLIDSFSRNLMPAPILIGKSIDISSTEVRERLAKNKKVDYLLPKTIHDYIKTKKLYQKTCC